MKRWVTCLSVVGLLAAPAGWAKTKEKKAEEEKTTSKSGEAAEEEKVTPKSVESSQDMEGEKTSEAKSTPVGKDQTKHPVVVVSEELFVNLAELPIILTDNGLKSFKERNYGVAGNDFASAGKILELQARATDDRKASNELKQAGEQMARIGERVSNGKVKSRTELEHELARVAYHKARFHRLQAIEEWNDKEARKAAHDLSAAAEATEHGFKLAGEDMSKGTQSVLDGAKRLSGVVLKGSGWTVAAVGKAIDDVGTEVKNLGDKLDKKAVAH